MPKKKFEEAFKLQTAYRKYNTPENPIKLSQSQFDLLCVMSMLEQESKDLTVAIKEKETVEQLKSRIIEYSSSRNNRSNTDQTKPKKKDMWER